MQKTGIEEIKKLAKSSRIHLSDEEIPSVVNSINEVLNYVAILNKAPIQHKTYINTMKNKNIFRPDIVKYFDTNSILKNAPEEKNNLFVVPTIIKKNK